jgi:hypothetical protein
VERDRRAVLLPESYPPDCTPIQEVERMMFRTPIALAVAGLILSGCADTTAPDSAALADDALIAADAASLGATVNPAERSSYPVTYNIFVCEEAVEFSGEVRLRIHWADPPSQATTAETFSVHARLHNVTGLGADSGDRYRLLGQQSASFGPASFGSNGERFTTVIKQRYIRQGSGKVAEVTSTFHFVANRNGVILERSESGGGCL